MSIKPLLIGLALSQTLLNRRIAQDHSLLQVHRQHLAGTQATALYHVGGIAGQHASFGGYNQQAVRGQGIAHGAQAVAVKSRANKVAIAKDQGRGTVPRLHTAGMVLTPRPLLLRKPTVLLPGWWNQHLHAV